MATAADSIIVSRGTGASSWRLLHISLRYSVLVRLGCVASEEEGVLPRKRGCDDGGWGDKDEVPQSSCNVRHDNNESLITYSCADGERQSYGRCLGVGAFILVGLSSTTNVQRPPLPVRLCLSASTPGVHWMGQKQCCTALSDTDAASPSIAPHAIV